MAAGAHHELLRALPGLGWLERADRDGFAPDDEYRMVVRWVEKPGYDEGFVVLAIFDISDVVLLKRASPSAIPSL